MPACDGDRLRTCISSVIRCRRTVIGSSFATWKRCDKQRLHDVAIGPLENAVRWVGTNDCHAAATAKRFCPTQSVFSPATRPLAARLSAGF